MRLNPLDKLFSEFIRRRAMERAGGCERCLSGKVDYKQLHCAHMFSRRKHMVRYDDSNAAGLCPGCHRFIDDNALDKVRFFTKLLGEEAFQLLEARASKVGKVDENLVFIYLKHQIERILK